MHDWTDIEMSRRHRKDLLREAEERRAEHALRRDGKRRIDLLSAFRRELARDLGRAARVLRVVHARN